MKLTKDEELRRDKAIAVVWNEMKSRGWQMKWLAPIFNLHTDTIYLKIKKAREKEL